MHDPVESHIVRARSFIDSRSYIVVGEEREVSIERYRVMRYDRGVIKEGEDTAAFYSLSNELDMSEEKIRMLSPEFSKQLSMPERFAALNRIGIALFQEEDEAYLLHLIAQTACDLTGASFAAFTLRPMNDLGEPVVPSEGNLFHLAAVVGVTEAQKALFHRMPLGGEGLLAPIFRNGVSVRVADVLTHVGSQKDGSTEHQERQNLRDIAAAYARGELSADQLHSLGVPAGHPLPRSFLGVPLLDRERQVRGGLLLGHEEPNLFTQEDEVLLLGLASQAAVAIENRRLYRTVYTYAQETQAIFESSSDSILLIDQQGQITRENSAAQVLRTRLQQEALERLLFSPARQVIATKKSGQHSVTLMQSDGIHEYLVTASPLRPSQDERKDIPLIPEDTSSIIGAVLVCHEVTEIRRLLAERQRRVESEQRLALLQSLLDELPISVYLVRGPEARLVLANRATASIWGADWPQGYPMQQFLADQDIRIFDSDGSPLPASHLATLRAVQQGETVRHHQEVIRQPNGKVLPVLVNAVTVHLPMLELLGAASASSSESLQQEVTALVVHQDVTALKEAERLKDDFIGIAAHELRTPVAVMKGFAQNLLIQSARQQGPELADWQSEALVNIDQATIRLTEMIDDLLDISRIQAGRMLFTPEYFDLIALTRRIVTRFQLSVQVHQLKVEVEAEHFVVFLDPSRIEQVLNNVIGNAVKYSPDGGLITIRLVLGDTDSVVYLSVQDQGIGIPRSQQVKIFGRFARAENAVHYGIRGSGLGLFLCRELLEQQNGRIWFESNEGKGTTFFIFLPLATDI